MKEIPLIRNQHAIIDDADYLIISSFKWVLLENLQNPHWAKYAKTKINNKTVFMHRMIIQPEAGLIVDHINGNGLDNRRSNLRIVTSSQNSQNRITNYGTSKYKGVSWYKSSKTWTAQIRKKGRQLKHLGYFKNEITAAKIYDEAALEYFGEFAQLNFPLY